MASFFSIDPLGLFGDDDFKPQTQPLLTPAGKKLEKTLFETIKSDLFPENLASRFIGNAKKLAGARRRQFQKVSAGAGFTSPENIVSGDIGRGFLKETATRLGEAGVGARAAGGAKRGFAIKRLGSLQNFINLQSGTPILRAQAGLIKGEQKQAEGAQKGALLGSLAQAAAMSDVRIKENIIEISFPLEKIKKLTGYTYNYIGNPPSSRNGGVMAQDVEKVLPDAVTEIDDIKYVKYDAVIGLLVNAVNELREKIGV